MLARTTTRLFHTSLRTMSGTPNSLSPDQLRSLPFRQPDEKEKSIVDDLMLPYKLQPSDTAWRHYDDKARFHDPVSIADGLPSIKAQFEGMPKLFSHTEIKELEFLDSPLPKNILQVKSTVRYQFKGPGNPEKVVTSFLTYDFNGNGKIREHLEEWDGEHNTNATDGFFGTIQEWRKKATAGIIHTIM